MNVPQINQMNRSMKTTTGATDNELLNDPINERLSVESASDDDETYEGRFQKRGNASFRGMGGEAGKTPPLKHAMSTEWEAKFMK